MKLEMEGRDADMDRIMESQPTESEIAEPSNEADVPSAPKN